MPLVNHRMIISWRSFALSLLLGIAAALSYAAEPVDRIIESAVGWAAWRPVSGEIVMVGLDDRTLGSVPEGRFTRADHARVILGAEWGIGITGYASPGPDVPESGLVWIAVANSEGVQAREFHYGPRTGREAVKLWATQSALDMLRRRLMGLDVRA